jgi:hypothetical protein
VLLHYQLATWPSWFVAGLRALRFAWRVVHLVWVGQVIRKAWQQEGRTRSKPLFEYGPVKYLGDTLREYELTWAGVLAEKYTPKPGQCPKVRQLEWYEACRKRVCAKLAEHYLAERRNLPSHLKPCLPSSVEQTVLVVESKKVATFLSELGDMGRAALRLQAPTLATCPSGPRPTDEPLAVRSVPPTAGVPCAPAPSLQRAARRPPRRTCGSYEDAGL